MTNVIPDNWSSATSYSNRDVALDNGVAYRLIRTSAGTTSTRPSQDSTNWEYAYLIHAQNLDGICRAVAMNLSSASTEIIDSVPHFVQKTQIDLDADLRYPTHREKSLVQCDAEGRILIENLGIIEMILLRLNTRATAGEYSGFAAMAATEILIGDETDYNEIRNYFDGEDNGNSYGNYIQEQYSGPVYTYDGQYFYPAPIFEEGTEFEITYYSRPATLGSRANRINAAGELVNSAGQNQTQWIAAAPANTADNFVPELVLVEENIYTNDTVIDAIIEGATANGFLATRNTDMAAVWFAKAKASRERADKLLNDFTAKQKQSINQQSGYLTGR